MDLEREREANVKESSKEAGATRVRRAGSGTSSRRGPETRLGMGARVKYMGAIATVIRHGADKHGEYAMISLSGMKARVCPAMLTPLDAPRTVIEGRETANAR